LLQKTKLFRARNATFACFFGIMCPDRALGTQLSPEGNVRRQWGAIVSPGILFRPPQGVRQTAPRS
jgi:hypothetical protein